MEGGGGSVVLRWDGELRDCHDVGTPQWDENGHRDKWSCLRVDVKLTSSAGMNEYRLKRLSVSMRLVPWLNSGCLA